MSGVLPGAENGRDLSGRTVVHGLLFYPRGGSAQVVRYLARALPDTGWRPRLVTGSLGPPGSGTDARAFYTGADVLPVDFTPALDAWSRGHDPMDQPVPLQPSFEDRPAVPDRVFGRVSPALAERQVAAWTRALSEAGAEQAAVLHLHHLTPLNDAARRWPQVPVVTHLHGTELLFLEHLDPSDPAASPDWAHAPYWADRFRTAARRSARVLAVSPDHAARAARSLGLPDERLAVVPNGVDTEMFQRLSLRSDERLALLRRWLVERPLGWDAGGRPGSIAYSDPDLSAFVDADTGELRPVLLFVGRFTEVKRLPLLLHAYRRVRERLGPVAPLLVWGGHPGEWEGEHPYDVARRLRVDGVFFAGWRDHDQLRLALGCADLLVAPSVGEAFGAVYLEAMAAGVPVVATRSGGPPSFVNLDPGRPEGWLVRPDDEDALVDALVHALTDPAERRRRGEAAYTMVRRSHAWSAVAERVAEVYEAVLR